MDGRRKQLPTITSITCFKADKAHPQKKLSFTYISQNCESVTKLILNCIYGLQNNIILHIYTLAFAKAEI